MFYFQHAEEAVTGDEMKQVPYNTGKVAIGSRWMPPPKPVEMSRDMERLQTALICHPKKVPLSYILLLVLINGGLLAAMLLIITI